ncbi:MAG: indole-3-glycerol phosphate synthase TrpC [Actinomycetota bacterium]
MTTYLDRILEVHRQAHAADPRPLEPLLDAARKRPAARGFAAALRACADHEMAVIAEVKRRSPSKGDLAAGLDPAAIAQDYARGGAACISVLTDEQFFGGLADDLQAVHAAVSVPVLRKDFTVGPKDVCDARLMGADAVLLIVAALDDDQLGELQGLATELGIDALVEVHDEPELDRALRAGATLIGVNQRDLVTFAVDGARAARVARAMPEGIVRVAESGIGGPDDVPALIEAGFHALLVGESVVTASDPAGAVSALRRPRQ